MTKSWSKLAADARNLPPESSTVWFWGNVHMPATKVDQSWVNVGQIMAKVEQICFACSPPLSRKAKHPAPSWHQPRRGGVRRKPQANSCAEGRWWEEEENDDEEGPKIEEKRGIARMGRNKTPQRLEGICKNQPRANHKGQEPPKRRKGRSDGPGQSPSLTRLGQCLVEFGGRQCVF